MPSPFPGMDPYLEHIRLWPDVHAELISAARVLLNQQIKPAYRARIEERVYVSEDGEPGRRVIVPDLLVREDSPYRRGSANYGTGLAVAEPIEFSLVEEEIRESRIEIIDADGHRVVAVIEFVSPTNKVPGSAGRESYQQKVAEVSGATTHLVEIDLLRAGQRLFGSDTVPRSDYLVHVSRHEGYDVPRRHTAWPILLRQRLPVIAIPLSASDADASLDLQAVLDMAYDRAEYADEVDYRKEAAPPVGPEDADWARQVLVSAGKR